jgi:hypothetical protein
MVAAVEPIEKSRECTAQEAYFARLVACDGYSPSRAYKIAWKSEAPVAKDLGPRVRARVWVDRLIAQLRERADAEGIAGLNERRRLLAEKYRVKIDPKKLTHREQIAAIELDSKLNGDLRPDVVNVAVGVSIGEMLGELSKGVGVIPVASAPDAVQCFPQQGGQAASRESHKLEIAGSSPAPAPFPQPIVNIAPTATGPATEGILPAHAMAPIAPEVWEGDE